MAKKEKICPDCGGTGFQDGEEDNSDIICQVCNGNGFVRPPNGKS